MKEYKKKILMVSETMGSGVFVYLYQLCNAIVDYFDVYLAYSPHRIETPSNFKDYFDSRIHLIEYDNLGKDSIFNICSDFKAIRELREIEKQISPDIIHLHSSIAGGIGRLAFAGKNKTILYTPHGYSYVVMESGIKCTVFKILEKLLGRFTTLTIACCESEEKEARKFCKKVTHIETGINLKELSETIAGVQPEKNKKFTVYTLGRVCNQKNPKLFNDIAKNLPNLRFLWIGGGDKESMLTSSNIEITGWLPREEALAKAMGADAFLLCSIGEGLPVSLLENMYLKKLSIVSNVIGNKSVIHNNVNGYVCDNLKDYIKCIDKISKSHDVELNMIQNAYDDIISIYNINIMTQKYIDLYSSF